MTHSKDIFYWLALSRAPLVGYKIFAKILQLYPNLQDFFKQSANDYREMQLPESTIAYLLNPDWKGVEADLVWESQNSLHHILTFIDPHYPIQLKETANPPPILYVKGKNDLLTSSQLGVVGSRKPSSSGKEIAFDLAKNLGLSGLTVTSGLALGIDTAAHQGALKSHTTIAVIGCGINICYPKSNHSLAEQIGQQGAIISEFPIDTPPLAPHFPRRNRIISGLSLGIVVVEANVNSGSLITANYALEQNREVFAVPGSIYNLMSKGCHLLIKQGAKLVEGPEDIFEELGITTKKPSDQGKTVGFNQMPLDGYHLKLLECIDYEPTKIDVLVARSGYSIQKLTSILFDLELSGDVCSTADGYRRCTK